MLDSNFGELTTSHRKLSNTAHDRLLGFGDSIITSFKMNAEALEHLSCAQSTDLSQAYTNGVPELWDVSHVGFMGCRYPKICSEIQTPERVVKRRKTSAHDARYYSKENIPKHEKSSPVAIRTSQIARCSDGILAKEATIERHSAHNDIYHSSHSTHRQDMGIMKNLHTGARENNSSVHARQDVQRMVYDDIRFDVSSYDVRGSTQWKDLGMMGTLHTVAHENNISSLHASQEMQRNIYNDVSSCDGSYCIPSGQLCAMASLSRRDDDQENLEPILNEQPEVSANMGKYFTKSCMSPGNRLYLSAQEHSRQSKAKLFDQDIEERDRTPVQRLTKKTNQRVTEEIACTSSIKSSSCFQVNAAQDSRCPGHAKDIEQLKHEHFPKGAVFEGSDILKGRLDFSPAKKLKLSTTAGKPLSCDQEELGSGKLTSNGKVVTNQGKNTSTFSGEVGQHCLGSNLDEGGLGSRYRHQVQASCTQPDCIADLQSYYEVREGNGLKRGTLARPEGHKEAADTEAGLTFHQQGNGKTLNGSVSMQHKDFSKPKCNDDVTQAQKCLKFSVETSPNKTGHTKQSKLFSPTKKPNVVCGNFEKLDNKVKGKVSHGSDTGQIHDAARKYSAQIAKHLTPNGPNRVRRSSSVLDTKSRIKSQFEASGTSKLHIDLNTNQVRAAVEAAKEAQKAKCALKKKQSAASVSTASKISDLDKILNDSQCSPPLVVWKAQAVLPMIKPTCRCLFEPLGNASPEFDEQMSKVSPTYTETIFSEDTEASVARDTFEGMLETLSRTRDSIARATRQALDCANFGMAHQIVDLIVQRLENEPSLHRRVDLFFLVDSITQLSAGAQGAAGTAYPQAVQAALPQLLRAAAPAGSLVGENQRQCLKVLRLWSARKIMPESVLRKHMMELDLNVFDERVSGAQMKMRPYMNRTVDDPIREIDGICVNEYGSNVSLTGLNPRPFEHDEDAHGSQREGGDALPSGSFEAENLNGTSLLSCERHRHILEDVEGELEMEDALPEGSLMYEEALQRSQPVPLLSLEPPSPASSLPLPPDCSPPPSPPPPLPESPPPLPPPPPLSPPPSPPPLPMIILPPLPPGSPPPASCQTACIQSYASPVLPSLSASQNLSDFSKDRMLSNFMSLRNNETSTWDMNALGQFQHNVPAQNCTQNLPLNDGQSHSCRASYAQPVNSFTATSTALCENGTLLHVDFDKANALYSTADEHSGPSGKNGGQGHSTSPMKFCKGSISFHNAGKIAAQNETLSNQRYPTNASMAQVGYPWIPTIHPWGWPSQAAPCMPFMAEDQDNPIPSFSGDLGGFPRNITKRFSGESVN